MSEQLDGGAIREVERLTRESSATLVEINGNKFATTPLYDDPRYAPESEPKCIALATLQSFADFVKGQAENYPAERKHFVHVESPTKVRLCTGVFGEFKQRAAAGRSTAIVPEFPFGRYVEQQEFVVALFTQFETTPDRDRIAALVSTIQWEAGVKSSDDGKSQMVTARRGVQMGTTFTPEIIDLRPFRTFSEIDPQPTSKFMLRVRGSETKPGECMLSECDGGRWRLDAIKSIKAWLAGELGDDVAVYG